MANKKQKTLIIFLVILSVVLSLTVLGLIFKDQAAGLYDKIVGNKFVYQNITFEKQKLGSKDIYVTQLAIEGKDGKLRYFILNLLNDPRKLGNERNLSKRILPRSYVSFTNTTLNCSETSLAGYKLGEFATALGSEVTGAVTDYAKAVEDLNQSGNFTAQMIKERVKNCSDSEYASVIILDSGYDKQNIFNDFSDNLGDNENCYVIQAKGCDVVKAAESYILDLIYVMQSQPKKVVKIEVINDTMFKEEDTSEINLSELLNASNESLIVGS